ncbi:hypothetical protein E3N88_04990 [Mikania micrantha]|uniref:AMP-dependent synthetase/ligase domain-containing protein n=1 Tax=Mikania micrantha TaxID=192012 RepID=A0A5N6PWH7_9ASTR|nr:hypothetical protein E3N88_04990 [Mikania micrantha]
MPVFLWTVDMFRCNGWCFPWAIAALGGMNVCLREVTVEVIFKTISDHEVTHLCGPPTILEKIASFRTNKQRAIQTRVDVIVAGPLPPLDVILKVEKLGFVIHHGYGMSESLGPMTDRILRTSDKKDNSNDNDELVKIRCREGTHNILMEDVDVKDPKTMTSVPLDGKTIGEIVFRGNVVMLGYLKNLERTQKAFKGGWYRTGDLGIRTPNGDIVMKDRALDVVTIQGEIVSTMEIERVIRSHPFVKEVAVVGKPDNVMGEAPCAFVMLKDECYLSSNDIIKFCEDSLLPQIMVPITEPSKVVGQLEEVVNAKVNSEAAAASEGLIIFEVTSSEEKLADEPIGEPRDTSLSGLNKTDKGKRKLTPEEEAEQEERRVPRRRADQILPWMEKFSDFLKKSMFNGATMMYPQ